MSCLLLKQLFLPEVPTKRSGLRHREAFTTNWQLPDKLKTDRLCWRRLAFTAERVHMPHEGWRPDARRERPSALVSGALWFACGFHK
ncbi:hypothetical protein EYF80_021719 [Liparis tanakae]|uniref:Uncharacterized protein n=1 Tax=Liparis tanakae TaxID=230148 RepID=A0A4Z2HSU4_9TELE|nr:hypothetical protein EYF80_021719 [Liparis tanakae]